MKDLRAVRPCDGAVLRAEIVRSAQEEGSGGGVHSAGPATAFGGCRLSATARTFSAAAAARRARVGLVADAMWGVTRALGQARSA